MQLLKTGAIKVALTGPTSANGIPEEMEMFSRDFLPGLLEWCTDRGFELLVTDLQKGTPTKTAEQSKEYLELSLVTVEEADIVVGSVGPDTVGIRPPSADDAGDDAAERDKLEKNLKEMFSLARRRFPFVDDFTDAPLLEIIWRHAWVNTNPDDRKPAMFAFRNRPNADETEMGPSHSAPPTEDEAMADRTAAKKAESTNDQIVNLKALIAGESVGCPSGFPISEYSSVRSAAHGIATFILNQLEQIMSNASFAEELLVRRMDEDCYAHLDFLQSRSDATIGKTQVIRKIADELLSGSGKQVVAVNGAPGGGKSSAIVAVANDVMTTMPNTLVHLHFCSASPAASDVSNVIARATNFFLGEHASAAYAGGNLAATFKYALEQVCAQEEKVILVIDGYDEIKLHATRSAFLPEVLPRNFKLLVSFTAESWPQKLFKRRTDTKILDLGVLDPKAQREMITAHFNTARNGERQLTRRASFSVDAPVEEDHLALLVNAEDGEASTVAPSYRSKKAVRPTGTLFEVKMAGRKEFNQVYLKRGVSSSWQIYLPVEQGAPKCTIKCINGMWEMRDPSNAVVYVNSMELDAPPQLGWRDAKDDNFDTVPQGPYMLCLNRPSYLPLFLECASLEVEAAAHEVGHLTDSAVAVMTSQTVTSVALCGSAQSVLQLTVERLEVRYSGTIYEEALRKVLIHLCMARGGLHESALQEFAMSHAFGERGYPLWATALDHENGSVQWARGHWYIETGWLPWKIFIATLEPLISHVSGRFYLKNNATKEVVKSRYLSRQPFRWAAACVHADFYRSVLLDEDAPEDQKAFARREVKDKAQLKADGVDLDSANPAELDYSYCNVGKGGKWICEAMQTNDGLSTNVRSINLRSNSLQNEGALAFAEMLNRNATLQSVNLSFNSIGDDGASALGKSLAGNTALQELVLEGNIISSQGVETFGKSLMVNATLFELDLSNNSIGGAGVMALGQSLAFNKCLRVLHLDNNSIGSDGGVALGRALEVNSVLRKLGLAGNRLGNTGFRALVHGLEKNTTLTTLTAHDNSVVSSFGVINLHNLSIAELKEVSVPIVPFSKEDEQHDLHVVLESDAAKGLGFVTEDASNAVAFPKIVRIHPNSAAWKEPRIKVGLRVRSINGVRAVGMTSRDVTRWCSSQPGRHVRLELAPPLL